MTESDIKAWKPDCCKKGWYVKGRANFRCKGCERDVTIDVVMMTDLLEKEAIQNIFK